ncbi:hypothetical protein V1387_04865 [Allomuricauda taeanensis]|uniref:hypothetical protein n=1 Tax=Flagellimonas taeanensis TaxID=1005926 RepID=UPI002E7BDA5F|nr:hypothetical protein [Allomuricauda taeanensis]MEE1962007.1 hypothetical protein [Allomuricauda taeanensis]
MSKILTGTILIPETTRSQLIYSSQVYNTHFNVFAEFISNGPEVTQMNFDFVNYSGPINLGIVEIGNLLETSTHKTKFFVLPLTIQGIPEEVQVDKKFSNQEFLLDQAKANYLIIVRNLKKLSDGRVSSKPPTDNTELDPDSTYNSVFDTEFFNRDGIRKDSINSRNRLPQANAQQVIDEIDKISKSTQARGEMEIFELLGGYRCMYSASKIIIS